mmetsp:Transcript_28760/g.47654  ORF Transcript_28760/g.47654 Transcript_28760/m.47654 type:complete len:80 (-) Transcript_28760:98-337(-)
MLMLVALKAFPEASLPATLQSGGQRHKRATGVSPKPMREHGAGPPHLEQVGPEHTEALARDWATPQQAASEGGLRALDG